MHRTDALIKVYDRPRDLYSRSLCAAEFHHQMTCLKRQCTMCGIKVMKLLPGELDQSYSAEILKWGKCEKSDIS